MMQSSQRVLAQLGLLAIFAGFIWQLEPALAADSTDHANSTTSAAEASVCYSDLLTQKNLRTANVTIQRLTSDLDYRPISEAISLIRFEYRELILDAVSYDCRSTKSVVLPSHIGLAWLITIPQGTEITTEMPERGHPSHGFVGASLEDLLAADQAEQRPRLILSGPFWRVGRYHEEPIGIFVKQGELVASFKSGFSAAHVLCVGQDKQTVSLLGPREHGDIDQDAVAQCSSAIQVGPAFFENSHERGRVGIGATSTYESRRNVLALLENLDQRSTHSRKLVLLSTITEIGAFDAMVLVDTVADQLYGSSAVRWAIGLVDDESLLGPILLAPEQPPLRLTQTNRPFGAALIFRWPE